MLPYPFFLVVLFLTACAAPLAERDKILPATSGIEPTPLITLSTTMPEAIPSSSPTLSGSPTISPTGTGESTQEATRKPAIILHQQGGFAGVDLTWSIYKHGQIVTPDKEEHWVDPAVVVELLEVIAQTGFFELEQEKPKNICCDFFTYTLAANNGEQNNIITFSDGDPNLPPGLSDAVSVVKQLIGQQ